MPLLEYRCGACGATFERLVRSTANEDAADCPTCKAGRGQRLLSVFSSAVRGGDGACTADTGARAAIMGGGGCCGGGACDA